MLPEIVENYLNKYAFQSWNIEAAGTGNVTAAIVIPAICEYENIKKLLNCLSECENKYFSRTLVIFVINNSSFSSPDVKEDNRKSLNLLRMIINNDLSFNDILIDKVVSKGLRIALIDAASEGKKLPDKDAGVGLARKIGLDLALTVFDYSSSLKNILICLDADCLVDRNYISEIIENYNSKNISAAVIKYEHRIEGSAEEEKAIICYEIFLRYYELGLKFANSSYYLHTIGSTTTCDFKSYIKSEGMNKKKAAEDFYFLEKLIKNVPVEKINSTIVYPSPRKSWRVPFGTGQRITRYFAGTHNEYLLFDPQSFIILKEWLELFITEPAYSQRDRRAGRLSLQVSVILKHSKEIDENLFHFLENQHFEHDWQKILINSKTQEQIRRQKMRWFDSFRTLKLIHFLRDNGYPMMDMFDALDLFLINFGIELPERTKEILPGIIIQKKYLDILRSLT